MLTSIICVSILLVTVDMVHSKYVYRNEIEGWIKVHHMAKTWEEAYLKCRSEGYSTLASPVTSELRETMIDLFDDRNTSYFIGTSAMFYPGPYFRSIEGMSIEDMNVTDMIGVLDSKLGQCLSMDRFAIRQVSCTARLPYLCYKRLLESMYVNECGTTEQVTGYKYSQKTGSCYKLHSNAETWDNAYIKCVEEGGYLVVINDEEEAQVVYNITGDLKATKGHYYISVGMRDWQGTRDWMTVLGHRVDDIYDKWYGKYKNVFEGQFCGRIYFSGLLDTGACAYPRPFVCEKDPNNVHFTYKQSEY